MKKILFIQTASLGDVILANSALESFHAKYPDAAIDFLLKKEYASLFDKHPYINTLILFDRSKYKISEIFRLLRQIRKNKYDAVVNIQRFFSSGFITAFSGAKIRVGFNKNPMSFLFTLKCPHRFDNTHEIYRNAELLTSFKVEKILNPKLYIDHIDISTKVDCNSVPYITIAPASLWFTKQLPVHKWVELINTISEKNKIFIIGSASESVIAEKIIRAVSRKNIINLCGKLSFLESAALMKKADMNYVNDSAPMHLASSVNACVSIVYCSTIPEFGFGPLSENSKIISINYNLNCRPCGLHGKKKCPKIHFKCANDIKFAI